MSGHYCTEHETVFFKKGRMKGYAHPVEGTEPTEWCNESEEGGDPIPEEVAETPKQPPREPPKGTGSEINRSMALSYAKDIAIAKMGLGEDMSTLKILAIAEVFVSYIANGVIVEKK